MERCWPKSCRTGTPSAVDVKAFSSIAEMFERSVAKYREKPAYVHMGAAITYAEVERLSRAFAAYLHEELELEKGARIALMMPNLIQYPVTLLGALRGGYVAVNCSPLYTARELERQLADSGAEAIVVLQNFASVVQQALPGTVVRHAHHHSTITAGILDNLARRGLDRLADDFESGLLVGISDLDAFERLDGAQQRDAAAGRDAFLDRGAGGVQRVVDTVFLLLDLDFRGAADADHRDAASELGETLLQLLAVIVRRRLLDLALDLRNPALDFLLLAGAVDDRRVLLLDAHALGAAELSERDVLELDPKVLGDHLTGGEDGDILEQSLAVSLLGNIAEQIAKLRDDRNAVRRGLPLPRNINLRRWRRSLRDPCPKERERPDRRTRRR